MTYTKHAIIFAFASLLLAMPLANSAFADGDANLDPTCGVTTPTTIDLGSFSLGADGGNVESSMATTGSQAGTLEVVAGDWLGVGQPSRGSILLVGVATGDSFTINGLAYNAVATLGVAGDFVPGATDTLTATALEAVIDADVRSGTTDDVVSTADENMLFLEAVTVGTAGDAITLVETVSDAGTLISGATFSGGEATAVKHMESTATKYTITTDGSISTGQTYAQKTALAADTVLKVLTIPAELTAPGTNVRMSLQISGVGTLLALPYDGALDQTLAFTVSCQ